ncbi:MAG: [FeFe] hydrogenase H-cluster radical SAM maturase HydE [Bdellovibrionales bacterium]
MMPQTAFSREEIADILGLRDKTKIEAIRQTAQDVLLKECGDGVYMRGLVEISNACRCDCCYCGIRKSNRTVERYTLTQEDILKIARKCAAIGYGSIVLQSGERQDPAFLDELVDTLRRIKEETRGDHLPDGLGITLCIGEQTESAYRRLFEAGAHRYLLRIETTNPTLFAQIHPPEQKFETRLACLRTLKKIGYQVGTGVMIGLPGQTLLDLADDILFFKNEDIDMIGMGPFIPHKDTPLGALPCPDASERFRLGLMMIAATRLVLRDVNIAATTALQALDPLGREKALRYGANVMMPLMTPEGPRENYELYPGKPFINETSEACHAGLAANIAAAGRTLGLNVWGDAPHATRKA